MPCAAERASRLGAHLVVATLVACVGCSNTLSAPDPPEWTAGRGQSGMLGVWTGTIASAAAGEGAVVLVLDGELITPTIPLVSGRWRLVFPDARFSGEGPARAVTLPENGRFVVTFDRVPIPCPSEPGGAVESVLSASLVRTGDRLRGRYITGLCSEGGAMDLERQ